MALIGTMKYLTIGNQTYEIAGDELQIASASTLGGIKVGSGLSIDATTGVLSTSITESDPVFAVSAAAGITSTDISNWNSKTSNTGTVTQVIAGTGLTIGSATSGGNITTSGTINHINSVTAQTTQAVYPIKIDAQGHISGYGSAVTSMPASDVSAWAKATSKPTYTASEVGAYTTSEVDALIEGLPKPMVFKGSLGTGGIITSLPTATASNEGYTYKVITAGTYASQSAKVGDTFISDGSSWVLIPSGDEPSGTVTSVGVVNATNGGLSISGSPITNSGTISVGHSNVLASAQTTSGIYPIKIDKNGHISEYGNAVSIPSISLNGSSTTSPSFYAPTSAGTYGYVLKSNGSGAPTWTSATLTDEKVKTTPTTLDVLNGYLTFSSSATETTNTLNKHSSIQIAIDADTVINGQTQLTLGNTIVEGDSGAKIGVLELYGPNQYMVRLTPDTLTDTRLIKLPNKAGTIALTSDIPTVPTIYLNDAPATLYSFYAPTTAGTSGQVLTSNGSGAPIWAAAQSGSSTQIIRWTES